MSELVDIRVVGLLCSRLCHELVNPLGAVNNGIELLVDVGDDMRDDALRLIGTSAERATRRVQFYRMAYGTAGMSALEDLAAVRTLADGLLAEGRVGLEWPDAARNPPLREGWGRMLLNMAVAAADTMPRGGTLTVSVATEGSGAVLGVVAQGDRARIEDDARPVYAGKVEPGSLTARTVHAYFTRQLARDLGGTLEVSETGDGTVRLEARLA